jgi:hypothetical protein
LQFPNTDEPLQLITTQEHGQWHIMVAYNRFVTRLSARPFSSPPCLSAGCPAHPWAGVQASYFWLEDLVAALPTPQSLTYRQWVVVVAAAAAATAAAAAGALFHLPHHRSTPRQKFPLPPIPKWSSLALSGKEVMKPPSCEIKKEGLLNRSVGVFPRFAVRFY